MGATAGYCRPVNNPTGLSTWAAHRNRYVPSVEPGTDYYCPRGTPVRAAAGGRIVDVGDSINPDTGRYVTIDLDDGRRVRYLHLERRHVNVGDYVQWGQHIADSGATGYGEADWSWNVAETGGAHVHMTIWSTHRYEFNSNATLDPELYMEDDMALDANADYAAFSAMLQRALRFDVRPNGVGADWKLGPTVWERFNGVESAARQVITPEQVKQIADAVVAAVGKPTVSIDYAAIADAVNDDAAKRLAG